MWLFFELIMESTPDYIAPPYKVMEVVTIEEKVIGE